MNLHNTYHGDDAYVCILSHQTLNYGLCTTEPPLVVEYSHVKILWNFRLESDHHFI